MHFTSGTPARLTLQIIGTMSLFYSVNIFSSSNELIDFYRGIGALTAGIIIFLLREHVSNGDYFKEFAKYAEENLQFQPQEIEEEPEGYS